MIYRLLPLLILLLWPALSHGQADTIRVSTLKGDLTVALRNRMANHTSDQRLVVFFDQPGTYPLYGSVTAHCHTEIMGLGADNTIIEFQQGTDRPDFKAMKTDCYIGLFGTADKPIEVDIHDIGMRMKPHSDIWWADAAKLCVKIYHARRVDVHRTVSQLHNAVCTNFDLRVCSNVTFEDNVIDNMNNSSASGNLWLRGATDNVTIRRNRFTKHGNDELLAFFSDETDAYHPRQRHHCKKSNITVENNTFTYTRDNTSARPVINDLLISVYTEEEDGAPNVVRCDYDNVRIAGNTFHINGPVRRTVYLSFIAADTHRRIAVENNTFTNTAAVAQGNIDFHCDFWLYDISSTKTDTLCLRNNTANSSMGLLNGSDPCYYHSVVYGATALLDGHRLTESIAKRNGNKSGPELLNIGDRGGNITLRNCVAKGLSFLAVIASGHNVDATTINAENNYFSGDTRIYCNNVDRLDLRFERNTFSSNSNCFLLQEFAKRGTLIFNRNDVAVAGADGQLMTHWNTTPVGQMRFERLELIGNRLQGVNQSTWLEQMVNVGQRNIRNNRF